VALAARSVIWKKTSFPMRVAPGVFAIIYSFLKPKISSEPPPFFLYLVYLFLALATNPCSLNERDNRAKHCAGAASHEPYKQPPQLGILELLESRSNLFRQALISVLGSGMRIRYNIREGIRYGSIFCNFVS
jgi:hypothetical protein